ncbi:Oidioi.mRNA.OKI2018_I69.PAR.g12518.t1.cds [Oikopleura dioica]|uniref:Oidioi.mRNA.OKI2018_I69.PAR.g12518.t1.cds n=1 Tax=Oikopleura dioica TaxID=34765 RepID=A0ABN7S6Q9_OIKDI|nr:Oidioi.mRNA.OKI2018_I69.PAR.g12518.t1.cds [Oikopleura dioica]
MGWQKIRESFSGKQIKQRVSAVARNTKISVLDAPIRTEFEPDILARLPKLTHVHPMEQISLFRAKIKYCSEFYSFTSKDETVRRYREHKSQTFIEFAEQAKSSQLIMNESIREDFVTMLHKNIVPPIPDYDDELSEEEFKDPQFEHIGFALNIFALILNNRHFKASKMKNIITQSLISDLFQQMSHPDERIRESLKTVIHQLYTNFIAQRTFIRREMNNLLLEFIYEDDSYRGVAERSLYFLNKPYIIELIESNLNRIMPQILPELIVAAEGHWNSSIVHLVCNILRSLMELDEDLFSRLVDEIMKTNEDECPRRSTARNTIARASQRASEMERRQTIAMEAQPNANY